MLSKKILGAQLYSVRSLCKTPEEIENTIIKMRKIGYTTIQVSGIGAIEPQLLKKICDDNDIKIVISHISHKRLTEDLDAVIKEHQLWNCINVGLGSMTQGYPISYDGFSKFIEEYSKIADILFENGLKFQYHNHKFEFEKFEGKTALQWMADSTSKDRFGFILDTCWAQAGGVDPAQIITDLTDRIDVIHYKDYTMKNNEIHLTEVMEGNLNWHRIFEAVENTNIQYIMVEQDECDGNPIESMKISYQNLSKFYEK